MTIAVPPSVSAHGHVSVIPAETSIRADRHLSVGWSGNTTPDGGDWMGLFAVGVPNDGPRVTWQYTGGASSGTLTFGILPNVGPGQFEFRLFWANSLVLLGRSAPVTISAPSLTVAPSLLSFNADRSVTVTWSGTHAFADIGDWIGLFGVGVPNDGPRTAWTYTGGAATGSLVFGIRPDTPPGTYEFRMFWANSLVELGRGSVVTIAAPAVPLSVAPTTWGPGQTVQVTWSDHLYADTGDWIGLYPASASDATANRITWRYTTGTSSGSVDFGIPSGLSPDTQYELRMFWANGLQRLNAVGQAPPIFGADKPQTFGIQASNAYSPDPVNLATGVFTAAAEDLALPGRVLGFAFTRTYNSADTTSGPVGPAWTHAYNWRLTDAGASVEVRRGDGRRDTFTRQPDGSYATPPDTHDTLVKEADGTFTLRLSDQVSYGFSGSGQLLRIREPAGNQISFAYVAGNLTSITDTVGRQVALSYDAQNRLTQLAAPLGPRVTYAYDVQGRLANVTDRLGNTAGEDPLRHRWTYAYDGASQNLQMELTRFRVQFAPRSS